MSQCSLHYESKHLKYTRYALNLRKQNRNVIVTFSQQPMKMRPWLFFRSIISVMNQNAILTASETFFKM